MKLFFILLIILQFSFQALATHVLGGHIEYKCVGIDQYEISLYLYRDCSGAQFPNSQTVNLNNISSTSCSSGFVSLPLVSGPLDITPVCPQFPATHCNSTSNIMVPISAEKYIYRDTVAISPFCDQWEIFYSVCCRNWDMTTIEFSTIIDKSVVSCNSSSVFTTEPTLFACANHPFNYSLGAYDPDMDSLSFSVVLCSGQNVSFNVSDSIVIDDQTGNVMFTPNGAQNGTLCIKVEEFRNGIKIGEILRDMPMIASSCSNPAPTISGIDNTDKYIIGVCPGQVLDFDIFISEPNPFQNINVKANLDGQPAPITISGTPSNTIVNFIDSIPAGFIGEKRLTIDVKDDGCPQPSVASKTFLIKVTQPSVDLGPNVTICEGESVTLKAKSQVSFNTYQWLPSPGIPVQGDTYTVSPSSTTEYVVLASNGFCSSVDSITVFVVTTIKPNITQSGDTLTASISGTAYQWYLDGNVIPGATNQNLIITQSGDYTVEVTDNNGCTILSDTFTAYKTGIQDILINGKIIKIYPNPADDIVIIDLTDLPTVADLHIYDNSGKLIEPRTGMSGLTEIDMSKYPDGVYYFKLKSEHEQVTKMIIKN